MKKKYILPAALLALTISSCTDLDVDVKSFYTEYPDSEIAIEAKTSDVYYAFAGPLNRRYNELVTFSSDEAMGVSFDGDYLDSGNNSHPSLHNSLANDACIGWYGDLSGGITKCNQVIIELGGNEASPVAIAPVRAVRAFYHFILMDCFGDIPILERTPEENEAVERTSRADVARWIESELLAIRDDMTTEVSAATYGKPTRWMVDALLAKLYINWNVYTKDVTSAGWSATAANEKLNDCIAACDDIIRSDLFNLSDDYKAKFLYNNGPHIKDFIYAMDYDCVTRTGMNYARFRTWRRGQNDGDGGAGFYTVAMSNSVGGNIAMTEEFANLFCLEGDRRNDCIVGGDLYQIDATTAEKTGNRNMYKGQTVSLSKSITLKILYDKDGNPLPMGAAYEDLNAGANITGWTQGWRSIKFAAYITEYNQYSRNQSNDVPIFRYADILLTKCEAILRGGSATNGDTPQGLFNQIRTYVHAPLLSANPTLDELLDERGREFFDENWRRNDLIRFGEYERDWGFKNIVNPTAKTKLTNRIFPLPQGILDTNTNWNQNDGY